MIVPSSVIMDAMAVAHDEAPEYQSWDTASYIQAFNSGLRIVAGRFPASLIDPTTLELVDPDDVLAASGTLGSGISCLDSRFHEALVFWVLFRFFITDASDIRDYKLANSHYAAFRDALNRFSGVR